MDGTLPEGQNRCHASRGGRGVAAQAAACPPPVLIRDSTPRRLPRDRRREEQEARSQLARDEANGPVPRVVDRDRRGLRAGSNCIRLRAAGRVDILAVGAQRQRHEVGRRRPVVDLGKRGRVEDEHPGRSRKRTTGSLISRRN